MGTPTEKQNIGKQGEDVACQYLSKHGFKILERNHWRKWGEIDIVARKGDVLHFIEVKTVSREVSASQSLDVEGEDFVFEPEDQMTPTKQKRFLRAIEAYLMEQRIGEDVDYQADLAAVYLDLSNKKAKVRLLEDIEL